MTFLIFLLEEHDTVIIMLHWYIVIVVGFCLAKFGISWHKLHQFGCLYWPKNHLNLDLLLSWTRVSCTNNSCLSILANGHFGSRNDMSLAYILIAVAESNLQPVIWIETDKHIFLTHMKVQNLLNVFSIWWHYPLAVPDLHRIKYFTISYWPFTIIEAGCLLLQYLPRCKVQNYFCDLLFNWKFICVNIIKHWQ